MKKFVMAAVIACLAVAAQAAYDWTVVNAGTYDGYRIVLIEGSGSEESLDEKALKTMNELFIKDSAKSESQTWKQYYAGLKETLSPSTIENGTAGGTGGAAINNSIVFILFKDLALGESYVLTETLHRKDGVFDFTNVKTLASGNLRTDNVPEPTSGLLLLLGVAGLALKRKQK